MFLLVYLNHSFSTSVELHTDINYKEKEIYIIKYFYYTSAYCQIKETFYEVLKLYKSETSELFKQMLLKA